MSTWITALLTVFAICLFAPADAKPAFPIRFHWLIPTTVSGYSPSGYSP